MVILGLLGLGNSARADVFQTYALAWSGASFSNAASATGQMTLDLTTLPNPNASSTDILGSITSLTVTVTGASAGNGTWTRADLPTSSATYWWTDGATLNMNAQLVGQATPNSPWGTPDGASGDFNLFFATTGAPTGTNYFTLTTNGGEDMLLTSFAPVPEPDSLALLGFGAVVLASLVGRRKRA